MTIRASGRQLPAEPVAVKCPKCGDTGYAGLSIFECNNLRCENSPFRRGLSADRKRQVDHLWSLYDSVSNYEARSEIWNRIWVLMNP